MSAVDRLSISQLRQLREKNKDDAEMVAYLDQKIVAAEANAMAQPTLGVGDLARAVGQGAWSFGDEIEAGVRTGFGLFGDYDATNAQINQEIAQAYDENPLAMNGVELASGFLIPGGNIARGVKVGNMALKGLKQAETITDAAKIGAVNGLANGAVDGLGRSDFGEDGAIGTATNIAASAVGGTLLGTVFGGGLPALARAIKGSRDPEAILRQVVAESGLTPEQINARLNELGPNATLADAFPVLRETAQGSVGIGGATDSVGVLAERNAEAPGRLVNEVEVATGKDIDSSRNEIEARKTERARVANEDYRPVDSATFSTDEAIELLESPLAKPYIKKAIEAYASDPNSGFNLEQLQKLMAGDPDMDIPGAIPARVLADARSFISDSVNTLAERGAANESRVLKNTLDQFDDFLDQVPGYTAANTNYARNSSLIGAIEEGERFAQNSTRYGSDAQRLRELEADPGLRGALATGAASRLINDLTVSGGNRQTGSATSRLGSSAQQRLRLEAAQVPQMADSIARENTFYDTFNQVDPKMGSKTAGATKAEERLTETSGALNMVNSALNPTEVVARGVAEKFKLKNKEVARQLTDILLKQGLAPEEIIRMLSTQKGMTELSEYLAKVGGTNAGLVGGILAVAGE